MVAGYSYGTNGWVAVALVLAGLLWISRVHAVDDNALAAQPLTGGEPLGEA